MRFRANPAALLLCLLASAVFAQQGIQKHKEVKPVAAKSNSPAEGAARPTPLLSANEGLSVIGAALESRKGAGSKADCSHLVHAIYERAGFPYAYASSSDLYAGVDEFRLVKHPQAGDLVVWPGHVGIVVNPSEQSFFSALRSGLGVESYSAAYWKERGRPRFYRYLKSDFASRTTETNTRTPSLARTSFDPRTTTEINPPLESVDTNPVSMDLQRVQVISVARPKSADVVGAMLSALAGNGDGLRSVDVFKLAQPVIVFSRIEVRNLKLKRDDGRVETRITQALSVVSGQTNLKKQEVIQKLMLQRQDANSWELSLPQNVIYVPQDAAVRVLAHQLAMLTETDNSLAGARQKSQLAQMLAALLVE